MSDERIWELVVIRKDRKSTNVMKSDLTCAEAKALKEEWLPFFCEDSHFDPVPELKVRRINTES
jgi:hypothetical protein